MATLQQLQEARESRHKLLIGGGIQSVGYDGKNVSYKPAELTALERYINQLERELGQPLTNFAGTGSRPVFF